MPWLLTMALVRKVSLRKLDPPVKKTFHDFADAHDVYSYRPKLGTTWMKFKLSL